MKLPHQPASLRKAALPKIKEARCWNQRYRAKAGVLVFGLMLLVAGCMVGPNFKTPPAAVADKWMEEGNKSVDSGASEHRDWWTVFNDPALTRLIQLAYERNLTLQTAEFGYCKPGGGGHRDRRNLSATTADRCVVNL